MNTSDPFTVRNFGNDRSYPNVEALTNGLRASYLGKSVSVHVESRSKKLPRVLFVDIEHDGTITETYSRSGRVVVTPSCFTEAAE